MLKSSLASGIMGAGSDVHDLGLCATPTLALHSQQAGGWGVMVTASHNPPAYNGLKVFFAGREVPDEWERAIERQLEEVLHTRSPIKWSSAGAMQQVGREAEDAHLRLLFSHLSPARIRRIRPRVVVDCANASACALMPRLLSAAGCRVEALNSSPGEPYGRELEPKKETLRALGRAVRRSRAVLGIAHDGDADRAIVMDERGVVLGLDAQLVLAATDYLARAKGGKQKVVVSTVESSLSLREACSAAGAHLLITPVGSRYVAAAIRARSAIFGGEPCGEYIFPGAVGVPDGLMAGLYFTDLVCRMGPLSKLAKSVPAYPMAREKIPCPNEKKQASMERIEKDWPFFHPSRVDGMRSDLPDGWVLVRPSGTEPYIRITAEGQGRKGLAERMDAIRSVVERAIRHAKTGKEL